MKATTFVVAVIANLLIVPFVPAQTPSIASLSLGGGAVMSSPQGPVKMGFVITGTNFGSAQGSSTATLNGATLTIVSWTNTSITVDVPAGATSGNVIVTVSGNNSNGVSFTVISPFGC